MNYTTHIPLRRKEAAREYVSLVQELIKSKYKHDDYIDCTFELYYHSVENKRRVKYEERKIFLTKLGYTQLMVVLLTYPDISFQDLPIYIPRRLYDILLQRLRLPRFQHVCNLSRAPRHSSPVAIEMTTLQQDAREIAGEDIYTFILPPYMNDEFQEVVACCECRQLEIRITQLEHDHNRVGFYTYDHIDAHAIQNLLSALDFRGIELKLKEMYNALSVEEQSDIFWPIHWLDRNNIPYRKKEEFL